MSHDKDDVHIISTKMVQKVQKNVQIHIVVWYNMRKEFCMLFNVLWIFAFGHIAYTRM